MAPDGENFRGINAARVLAQSNAYTLDKIIAAGYDTYLSAFELMVPALVKAFETNIKPADPLYAELSEAIDLLKNWDFHTAENSVAATLAIEWGERISESIAKTKTGNPYNMDRVQKTKLFLASATANELILPFA